ncbi:TPA: glycosyltransferase family 9 protein [Legionella pneumophila]|uniref:Glycosyltransferase family 9 protein n=2 Tax=Legionella pneumophila TaxID=446 RepID=A0A3A6WBR1_LEGPN|nr:ADP-heptose--LPS heptosyltransferase [Legionella pneumophila str. Leg01/11]PNL76957.1 ADP-heptose--LPS heptosyltransferase [Legionella pneumophila subsp. pneumophila]PPK26598.1 glycosyltransferase family 9 protein [Legionella pneumophila]PQM70563.1 glycosyltransferase family 9 protein [Legionella pneumophila]PYB42402.1 glycosyltransferase family 9 protein [Legionella pneumophila]
MALVLYCRMIKSICVIRLSALGDVLMLVPLIRTLQNKLPNAQLTWIISKPAFYLVEGMEGVEFIVIDKPKTLADYWRFRKQMLPRQFDVLLAPQASFRTNWLIPFIKAKRKVGYDSHRANDGHRLFIKESITPGLEHTLEGFLKFAEPLGVTEKIIHWDLPITKADYEWAQNHLPEQERPILVVNPAASKPERSWLAERYIEVLKQAQVKWDVKVVLTGGPGDHDKSLAEEIAKEIPVVNLVGKTKPKQLLAVISKAKAVLCPDTGPSHMAAAVGTPVVALHAVTNPSISGPYTFQHLVVNRYSQAIQAVLGVSPEKSVWGTQVHGYEAMKLITVDDVMEKLTEIFSGLMNNT